MSAHMTFRIIAPAEYSPMNSLWAHGGGSVYVVQEPSGVPIKIGSSWHPGRRLPVLQCGNPRRLSLAFIASTETLPGARLAEDQLKRRFASAVIINEWFEIEATKVLEALFDLYLVSLEARRA